jgi:hypothetical protein
MISGVMSLMGFMEGQETGGRGQELEVGSFANNNFRYSECIVSP